MRSPHNPKVVGPDSVHATLLPTSADFPFPLTHPGQVFWTLVEGGFSRDPGCSRRWVHDSLPHGGDGNGEDQPTKRVLPAWTSQDLGVVRPIIFCLLLASITSGMKNGCSVRMNFTSLKLLLGPSSIRLREVTSPISCTTRSESLPDYWRNLIAPQHHLRS